MYPDSAPKWLEESTILLAVTGSHAYGTATEESDMDYKGVCIPPPSFYLGLDSFNEYNTTGGKNFKNSRDDVDYSVIAINKFVKDAMSGVPNNIEILFTEPEDLLKVTDLGQVLIDNRKLFLSQQVKKKFGGYATSQIAKMKHGRKHNEHTIRHGYDTKQFSHAVRLLSSAAEILDEGDYRTKRWNAHFLKACRNGVFTFEEALDIIKDYDDFLSISAIHTKLPEKPDYGAINSLLMHINQTALDGEGF